LTSYFKQVPTYGYPDEIDRFGGRGTASGFIVGDSDELLLNSEHSKRFSEILGNNKILLSGSNLDQCLRKQIQYALFAGTDLVFLVNYVALANYESIRLKDVQNIEFDLNDFTGSARKSPQSSEIVAKLTQACKF